MSRVVRGGFPDREFDVLFWQEQGDEAIFRAAWDMVELAEEFKGSDVDSDVELKADFKELLRLLNQKQVKYLVVGGYAVMKYTEPFLHQRDRHLGCGYCRERRTDLPGVSAIRRSAGGSYGSRPDSRPHRVSVRHGSGASGCHDDN